MLRKLIMFAITSGLAKKAWNSYQDNRGMASSGRAGSRTAATTVKPKVRSKIITPDNRPDAF